MELSAPRAATALPPEPPSPPSGYIRPPEHRIHQLRLEMKSGLAQPRNKHEQFYIELHKYNVLAGRYGHLPTMLQPPRPAFKALPSTESLPPIEFPTFSDVQPQSAPQRPSILPASGPLSSTVFAIAAKAAQLLRTQGWIEELDDDVVNEVFAEATRAGAIPDSTVGTQMSQVPAGSGQSSSTAVVKQEPRSTPTTYHSMALGTSAAVSKPVASTNKLKRTASVLNASAPKRTKTASSQTRLETFYRPMPVKSEPPQSQEHHLARGLSNDDFSGINNSRSGISRSQKSGYHDYDAITDQGITLDYEFQQRTGSPASMHMKSYSQRTRSQTKQFMGSQPNRPRNTRMNNVTSFAAMALGSSPPPSGQQSSQIIDLTDDESTTNNSSSAKRQRQETTNATSGMKKLLKTMVPLSLSPARDNRSQRSRPQRAAKLNALARLRAASPEIPELTSEMDPLSQLQATGRMEAIATLPAGTRVRMTAEIIHDDQRVQDEEA